MLFSREYPPIVVRRCRVKTPNYVLALQSAIASMQKLKPDECKISNL